MAKRKKRVRVRKVAADGTSWRAQTDRLIGSFDADLKRTCGPSAGTRSLPILLASDFLWVCRGPRASWSHLDVEKLEVWAESFLAAPGFREALFLELAAFYAFLLKFNHIGMESAARISRQLLQRVGGLSSLLTPMPGSWVLTDDDTGREMPN